MDLTGQIVLAYLEEDDARRILFRARPLLTAAGPVSQEDIEELEQEGFLRIAPDRQEQHSFKDRMRSLGSLCLIDLSDADAALGKIRPNKNFTLSKGENNRYIVYSDAMRSLPDGFLYEVVSEDRGIQPLTKQYYLRSGGRISGPHCVSGADHCPVSHSLPPDCDRLFLVEMPDKTSRMFYWPQPDKAEPQPVQAEAAAPEPNWQQAKQSYPADPGREELFRFIGEAHQVLLDAGFLLTRVQTSELLMLCLSSRHVQISGDCPADARLAAKTLAAMFPGDISASLPGVREDKDVQTRLLYAAGPIIPADYAAPYQFHPWPVIHLISGGAWPVYADKSNVFSLSELQDALHAEKADLAEKTRVRMDEFLQRLIKGGYPLPLGMRRDMASYVRLMPLAGEISQEDALRGAVRFWVLPWLRFNSVKESEMTEMTRL